jgi:dTDP-glucose pyrophosphorylase
MNIVITMAGSGERFRRAGYDQPKFMLKAKGRTLFRWSMASLENFFPLCRRLIFIVREEDDVDSFIASELAEWRTPPPTLVPLTQQTDGQATSALRAQKAWDPDLPVLIYNIDTHVEPRFIMPDAIRGEGWIPCFRASGTHWSFVRVDPNGRASEVREKERISELASIGLYWFGSGRLYEWAYEEHFHAKQGMGMSERYIAPMYNELIAAGHEVTVSEIPASAVVPLGTPDEFNRFDVT